MIKLYGYFRSSTSYRVRIALNLKDLPHSIEGVHLLNEGGEHKRPAYLEMNPQGLVPTLQDEKTTLIQSLSILEYLDEAYPTPALLPSDLHSKLYVKTLCYMISCDIHPLNNLRVLSYLKQKLNVSEDEKNAWYQHWIYEGFAAIETYLSHNKSEGPYCAGQELSMADVCLIPQVYNANRFNCTLHKYPTIERIYEQCMQLDAFDRAKPESHS